MNDKEAMWTGLPKFSEGYINGIQKFIRNAFFRFAVGDEVTCPCKKCHNRKWHREDIIYNHHIWNGPSELYVNWIYEVSCGDPEKSDADMEQYLFVF